MEDSNVCSSEDTQGAVGENNEKLASSYNTVLDDDSAIDYSGEIKNVVGASGGEDLLGGASAIFNSITITNAIYGEDLSVTVNVQNKNFLNSAMFYVYLRQASTELNKQYYKTAYDAMSSEDVVFTYKFSEFKLTPGIEYNIYLVDFSDSSTSMTQKFTVSKADPTGTVSGTSISYGQTETVTASVPTNYKGTITFKLNTGEEKTATVSGSTATATFTDLEVGEYTVTASYTDDGNYYANSKTSSTFKVSKTTPTFSLTNPSGLKAGQSGTINLNLIIFLKCSNGNLSFCSPPIKILRG